MSDHRFDVVVLGAGPAGEVCAGKLAGEGLSVAIVERELIGGECSFWACMPSKALLRPGELLGEVGRVPGLAGAAKGELDVRAVLERRDEIVHRYEDESMLGWLDDKGIALFRGHGRLEGERRVRVGEDVLTASKAVVIATGSGAAIPPIDGLEDADPWTNREVTAASEAPPRLLVLGGGVVGVEMAQAWGTLGSAVTLLEASERLLAREEPFAGEQVAEALRERGVDVRTESKATKVTRRSGVVRVELEGSPPVEADEILVAVGRRPRTEDIGLDSVGLEPGEAIEVDDRLQAQGGGWLYAIGDVNGRALLTHVGKYQARIAAENIVGRKASATADGPQSPRVIFTDPQVAAVGHTLEAAESAGLNVRAVDMPTSGNAGGSFYGREAPGTTRFVVDEDRKILVGATFTGFEVAELLHAATIAVVAEIPLDRLRHAVPSFPTRSEVWLELLGTYGL